MDIGDGVHYISADLLLTGNRSDIGNRHRPLPEDTKGNGVRRASGSCDCVGDADSSKPKSRVKEEEKSISLT